jgi:protein involved in polysaccharide export with SLBB domain
MRLPIIAKVGAKVGFVVALAATMGSVATWAADPPPEKVPESIVPPDYKIGAGDIISIEVYKEPDASVKAALVRSDGKVTVPLLDDVYIQGMTTAEVKKELTSRLAGQIPGRHRDGEDRKVQQQEGLPGRKSEKSRAAGSDGSDDCTGSDQHGRRVHGFR